MFSYRLPVAKLYCNHADLQLPPHCQHRSCYTHHALAGSSLEDGSLPPLLGTTWIDDLPSVGLSRYGPLPHIGGGGGFILPPSNITMPAFGLASRVPGTESSETERARSEMSIPTGRGPWLSLGRPRGDFHGVKSAPRPGDIVAACVYGLGSTTASL